MAGIGSSVCDSQLVRKTKADRIIRKLFDENFINNGVFTYNDSIL